ncbi:MAG TPA: hypothetical protein VFZ00_23270 [Solirubrobacter sp.]|nr:hypothetical protein [Solirubrobacter sp.]
MQSAFAAMLVGDVDGWIADADRAATLLPDPSAALALGAIGRVAGGDPEAGRRALARTLEPTAQAAVEIYASLRRPGAGWRSSSAPKRSLSHCWRPCARAAPSPRSCTR